MLTNFLLSGRRDLFDPVDLQILDALQRDARITMRALGDLVGLSGPAVAERVRRLEQRGVLTGYRATVAPERLGLPIVAFVTLAIPHELRPAGTLERVVENLDGVVECYRITGEDAYLLKVVVPDLDALRDCLDRLGDFGRAKSALVLATPKQHTPLAPRPPTTFVRAGAD